jgi:DNA-binding transcriptional regulator LsrR (DeoR family)
MSNTSFMESPHELALMAHVARRYYLAGQTKSEIADELFLSRFKVARLLEAAQRCGVVEITINVPGDANADVARELEEALTLRRAVVVDDPDGGPDALLSSLGEAAITVLADVVREGDRVGIASTRTMLAVRDAPRVKLPRCTFVQLTGEIPRDDAANVMSVIRILTRQARGNAKVFYAPMVAADEAAWRSHMAQPEVRAAFAEFAGLDVVVTGVGSWAPGLSIVYDNLPPQVREEAAAAGAIAEVAGIPLDTRARTVPGSARRRVVAPDVEVLMRARERIGVVFDPARTDALRLAARAGVITTIVTQRSNAEALLSHR